MMGDRVALVTGAGGGIGRATAMAFAAAGAQVVTADIDRSGAEATAAAVREVGGTAMAVVADMRRADQVQAMVEETVKVYGRLDYAHNNAGVWSAAAGLVPTDQIPEETWDRILAVNLKGVWLCMKYELAHMREHGGAIVNTSSVLGLVGGKGHAAYVASKHGVVGLTKTAALEYARYGIRVNAVCPGVIRTEMTTPISADPRVEQAYLQSQAIRRYGEADEVAAAVVWLCSDAASFVTGHMMVVDGGQTAQ